MNRLSRAWCGRCACDHSRTWRYSRSAVSASPAAAAQRASWTRAWAASHGASAASAVASACRWSSSASRRSPPASAIAPRPARANAAWSSNPMRPRKLERAPVRLHRGRAVLPSLRDPCLQQQPRDAERVVGDRLRVTADRRRHRGDGGDVTGARRARRPDEAARRDAPVVPGRLERRAAASRAIASARSASPDCARASASVSCASPSCARRRAVAASASARSPAASAASRSSSSVAR